MMKSYISLSGFDSSQIVSLIVKYGIEGGDRIILIRPEVELDLRGEQTVDAVRNLSRQISNSIDVQIHRVNHRNFEDMVVSLKDLIESSEKAGQVMVNLSGGPREIFLAFAIACISMSNRISQTTCFGDIDRILNVVTLPNIAAVLEDKQKRILMDVQENGHTSIGEIAERLSVSESTISRQVARLADISAVEVFTYGKTKEVSITLTGKLLI
jgi:CRISPR-associated protein Csa3